MMRVCVLGDPHFKKDNLDIMKNACTEILSIISDRKPHLTVCLGDTLDTHERIYLRAQVQATNFFLDIARLSPLVIIIGNHDRENNSDFQSDIHPFVGLKSHPNITVVDKTVWDEHNNFIYVPYVPPGRFREALLTVGYDPHNNGSSDRSERSFRTGRPESSSPNDRENTRDNRADNNKEDIDENTKKVPRMIFCHQEFVGCRMGSIVSSKGDTWSDQLPWIVSGHIHEHQELVKIIYVGTFIQQNYGEGSDKAIMMVTLSDETENGKPDIERIHLASVPRRVTVHLRLDDLATFSNKLPPDMIPKNSENRTQGSLVRVILHVDATDTKSLKYNPHYRTLETVVDKVNIQSESNKASVAGNMVRQLQEAGSLDQAKPMYSLEEIVRAMLKDDPVTLDVFESEILTQTSSQTSYQTSDY